MKKQYIWIAASLGLIALFSLATIATAQAIAAHGRPVAVAVVDIETVLKQLNERTQVQADITTLQEKFKATLQEKQKELSALQEDLKIIAPTNAAFASKQEELGQKAFELQAWSQYQQNKLMREDRLRVIGLYREITDAAGKYAKANGYDIVLVKELEVDQLTKLKPEEVDNAIIGRKLLYYAPDLDISDAVITAMNNEYKMRKAAK